MTYNLEPSQAVLDPENYSYTQRDWRAPELKAGEELVFDEPGRVLPGNFGLVCHRAYYFRVLKDFNCYDLRVKHGGGTEEFRLTTDKQAIDALGSLDSDSRFRLFIDIWFVRRVATDTAIARAEAEYRQAFAEGRLKKRKRRGENAYKVWIESGMQLTGD